MLLKDALNECESSFARDSLSNLTETIVKTKNLSLSNWKSNYTSPRPMPFDPANFAVSYSYSQRYKTGETIVYENDENWKANFSYNYSPKYKTWEPFKKIKGKSKWLDIIKAQNLNYLPQSISFNTDLTRNYYEFQERDIDAGTQLPVVFSEQFLWNRQFNIRWDIFKALRLSYTSATHAEIEEPYTVINKSLYPDAYEAWKDSVKHSLASFGRPLTYNSTFTGSYNLPLNKIPLLDWISADGSYNASYHWNRGTELEDGTSLGHMANTQRTININSKINFETLYKKWSFLEKTEQRFSSNSRNNRNRTTKDTTTKKNSSKNKNDAASDNNKAAKEQTSNKNQKNGKSSTTNVTLNDSTNTELTHGFNTRRIIVKATTESGKSYDLKYKRVDANKISIKNQDTIPLKVTVTPKQPLEEKGWYKSMQVIARGLMMIRNANITYRNSYSLALPGLKNEIGDAFGQKSINGILSPGLDFAFGAVGDSYVNKAIQNGWLIDNDSSITTPITTNASEDIQVRMTLEPLRDLKIDLNATRVVNKSKSIRYMYAGMPVTQSGSFSMTVISASSAFANRGNIDNNYNSQPFNDFIKNIDIIQNRLENAYSNTTYPIGSGEQFEGKPYDPANGGIDKYSADVMVPAFLAAYCNNDARKIPLKIFPALLKMMPNWSVSYSGLSKLPWFANKFRSFNINHAYKSIYTVGAYNSFTNYMAFMGDMGFIMDVTTGNPIPNSMYNVNTVSINEAFSPLIGVDMTFNNGLTTRMEYRKTRTLNLSMTSVALTENYSDDIVVGFGYKIKDLNLFGAKNIQSGEKSKKSNKKNSKNKNESENDSSNKNSKSKTRVGGISHDLNLRLDFSYRMQNALNRNIQTQMTTATNGSTAYKLAMSADYVFSNLLTLSGFLDWQKNVPLVSTSSYPTTTADFGISMKFSLTR